MGNKNKLGLPGGPNEIIVDSRGQWDNPGKNTRIEGNNITMKDVAYPVWAQPNVGPGTMMMPGSEHYFKNAEYVDEYPMAQDGNGEWSDSETIDGVDYETVEYGTPEYRKLYNEGSIFAKDADGNPIIPLDEVVISGYDRNKLSPDQRALYNMFYKDEDYKDWMTRIDKMNREWKAGEAGYDEKLQYKRKVFTPQIDYADYQITPKDLFRLQKEAGSPKISTVPSWQAQLSPTQMGIENDSNDFRAHAVPLLNKMYIPPLEGASGFAKYLAEVAHLHPDFNFTETLSGTWDRIKRAFKEGQLPDDSNYESTKDQEYKTHYIAEDNILDYYFPSEKRDDWEKYMDLNRTPEEIEEAKADRLKKKMDKRGDTENIGLEAGGSVLPKAQDGTGIPYEAAVADDNFLNNLEKLINASIGNVNKKAQDFAYNPDEPNTIDNMRHAAGGRYATEAIQEKVKKIPYIGGLLDSLGVDKAAGFIGANLLGIGHELSTIFGGDERPFLAKLQEMGEDTFNNYVGSIVGSLDIDDSKKDEVIRYLSYNNLLPDGYVRTEQGKKDGLSEDIYFKDAEGKRKTAYQRGGGLLNKTMKCNSCGWSWKAADGGADVSTCHKCGGSALPKAQYGLNLRSGIKNNPYNKPIEKEEGIVNDIIDYVTPVLRAFTGRAGTNDDISLRIPAGEMKFFRNNEQPLNSNFIIGGDYMEEKPTAYKASEYPNTMYTTRGQTQEIDFETQQFYGVVDGNIKLGKKTDFRDDDVIVPLRSNFGGKFTLQKKEPLDPEFIKEIKEFNKVTNQIRESAWLFPEQKVWEEMTNKSIDSETKYKDDGQRADGIYYQGYKYNPKYEGILNKLEKKFGRNAYLYDLEPLLGSYNSNGYDILNPAGNKLDTFGNKVILFDPESNEHLFISQLDNEKRNAKIIEFKEKYPNANYLNLDNGRFSNYMVNEEGINSEDAEKYMQNSFQGPDATGYNFAYQEGGNVPKAQDGGSTSWNWKGKSYSGTLIPSMETKKNRYARTKNGKIKTLPKAQYGANGKQTNNNSDDYTIVPDSGIELDPVVITGNRNSEQNNSLEDMPAFMKVADDGNYTLSAEQQQQLKDLGITDLDSYNEYFGTSYSRDNALNEFNYLNSYKPEREELISSIHGATNEAAGNLLEAASYLVPVGRGISLLSKTPQAYRAIAGPVRQAYKYTANSPVGKFAAKYGTKYVTKPFRKLMDYKPGNGPLSVGNYADIGSVGYGAYNIAPDTKELYNNPSWSNAGSVGIDALGFTPFLNKKFTGPLKNTLLPNFSDDLANLKNAVTDPLNRITNPLSDLRVEIGKGIERFKTQGNIKARPFWKNFNENPVPSAAKFDKDWVSAPGFNQRYDNFMYRHQDPKLLQSLKSTKQFYDQGLDMLRLKQPDLFTAGELNMSLSQISKTFPRLKADADMLMGISQQNRSIKYTLDAARNASMNLDEIAATGKFTRVFDTTSLSPEDLKYFEENSKVLGFFRNSENRAIINEDAIRAYYGQNPSKMSAYMKSVLNHENSHALDAGGRATKPIYSNSTRAAIPEIVDDSKNVLTGVTQKNIEEVWPVFKNLPKERQKRLAYLSEPTEVVARIKELRSQFIPKNFVGTDKQYLMPDNLINKIISEGKKGNTSVEPTFFRMIKDKKAFQNLFKILPAVAAPIAIGAGQQRNGGSVPKAQHGGEKQMLKVYGDFINGKVLDQNSKKVYDKLNRIHYKNAKQAGMSVPNYIMSNLMGNS
jgi:hypothetical protein